MRVAVLTLILGLGGCLVAGTPTETTDTEPCKDGNCEGTDLPTRPTGTATQAPGAPMVESLTVEPAQLTEDQPVTIMATVSDVDGLSTILGGNVRGAQGQVIKAFEQVSDGRYQVELSWVDVNTVTRIEFEDDALDLGLVAAFFDTGNRTGTSDIALEASCGGTPNYACGGICVDASTSFDHCGSCNSGCDKGQECVAGTCDAAWSACETFASTSHSNCADLCGASGEVCTDRCSEGDFSFNTMVRWSNPDCRGGADYDFEQDRCDASYAWSPSGSTYAAVQCCCTIGAAFAP